MKLQAKVVQHAWTIPANDALEAFQNEVNQVLEEIMEDDDLVQLEYHTMELGGQGVSTAYITYWSYDFEEDDEFGDVAIDEMLDMDEDAPATSDEHHTEVED